MTRRAFSRLLTSALALACAGCGHKATVPELAQEFVYNTLSFSPTAASAAGLHEYKGLQFDSLLDDISPAGLARQRDFYRDFNQRLTKIDPEKLAPEDAADFAILQDRTDLGLLELERVQTPLHNPAYYVELLGNALSVPYLLEYAPPTDRYRDIIARLKLIPLFLQQASGNLLSIPSVWRQAALEENQGNIELVDKTLRGGAPPDVRPDYDRAAAEALPALRKFQDLLTGKFQYLDNYKWQLGSELYNRKFRHALEAGGSPQDMLASSEKELVGIRNRMYELALPLYRKLPAARNDLEKLDALQQQQIVIGAVLSQIADRHSTVESFLEDARKAVDEARGFLQQSGAAPLPESLNLHLEPTPAFEQFLYPVAKFVPAPALQPRLAAILRVTPVPADWPRDRAESKLRTENFEQLRLLALRQAFPGRYTQAQTSSAMQPDWRRLLRSVYADRAYVDGWAEYAVQLALDSGYRNHSPELALAFEQDQLRTTLDAALDVRLQTLDMSDREALNALRDIAFEDEQEAAERLRRAKMTSCQLPAAFVGWSKWLQARAGFQRQGMGAADEFHRRALREGAVPMSQLAPLLVK